MVFFNLINSKYLLTTQPLTFCDWYFRISFPIVVSFISGHGSNRRQLHRDAEQR